MFLLDFFIFWVVFFVLIVFLLFSFTFFNFSVVLDFGFFGYEFLDMVFSFDWTKLLFFCLLLVIFSCIVVYSGYYMMSDYGFTYFFFVLLVFVLSMFGLVFSSGCISLLVFWDLLGVSSYFLVLYYGNWDSCSGAMNTVMINRLGDFFLFLVFSVLFFFGLDTGTLENLMYIPMFFLLLGSFTKSAQVPFSSWLPKAMSAPTPVSALVHSSTLVTAGLFLMLCFSSLLNFSYVMNFIFFVGLFTMFVAGFCAFFECDMKKLVALSTLSQIGFCFFGVGLGMCFYSFIHMLSHAVFKSCLFLQVGYVIHTMMGQQDARGYINLHFNAGLVQLQIFICISCLCGLVFVSGAVSKEMLLESYFSSNWSFLVVFMFFFSVFLTYMYCYRMIKGFYNFFMSSSYYNGGSYSFSFSSILLVFLCIVFIWWVSDNMLYYSVPLLYFDYYSMVILFLLFLVFFNLVFNIISKMVKYKVSFDFIPMYFLRYNLGVKFMDLMLESGMLSFYSFFSYISKMFSLYFLSGGLNSIIFLLFFLLLF